jgi:hypothetical protein
MTLTETEETLQTLINRHPGLDDSMLVTLLSAGGWEEKEIQEARLLFKSRRGQNTKEESPQKNFPAPEEYVELPAQTEYDHLLAPAQVITKEETPTPLAAKEEKIPEPQSLTVSLAQSKREELPHDLPLRPFETSDHIWPFSRYKDVFYGDQEPQEVPVSTPVEAVVSKETAPAAPMVEVKVEEPKIEKAEPIFQPAVHLPSSQETTVKGDDKLVIIACVMLIAVLFVLGYMYSNGRL